LPAPSCQSREGFISAHKMKAAARRLSQNYPEGVTSQSPGLAALFAANPGRDATMNSTLKGLRNHMIRTQPFQGCSIMHIIPRVGRKERGQPWALRFCPFGAGVLRQSPCCRTPYKSRPLDISSSDNSLNYSLQGYHPIKKIRFSDNWGIS